MILISILIIIYFIFSTIFLILFSYVFLILLHFHFHIFDFLILPQLSNNKIYYYDIISFMVFKFLSFSYYFYLFSTFYKSLVNLETDSFKVIISSKRELHK